MTALLSCCRLGRHTNSKGDIDAALSQSQIKGIYDRIAPVYDHWGRFTESRARHLALELSEIKDGETVLEVAVGTGMAFYEIANRNPSGINLGIDLSPGMLAMADKRLRSLPHRNFTLKNGTALDLPAADAIVDTLVNNYMFDLIPFDGMHDILMEFKRVLKPGGKLVLVNMTRGETPGSGIYEKVYTMFPKLMGGCRGVKMAEKLSEHGFTIIAREKITQCFFPSEVILARIDRSQTY
ncbi:MAG: methyltransferase domain-containing protein [Desulfobacteraceae bacterium]|nr:methyltransferase domain-containing protein [Desulfobacteraceae bacterium]